jgi:ketosteroid isomerase-like protein
MADTGNRETIEKFWQAANARDWDTIEMILDPDCVWEMPQSGERVRGAKNNREMNENYPGPPTGEVRRIIGSEDRWVTTPSWTVLKITGSGDEYSSESRATYPDGSVWHSVDFFRFRNGKIYYMVSYYAPTTDAPEWRARWVERF